MSSEFPAAPSNLALHWTLDPEITFLNHGSFGACPRVVIDEQTEWRRRLEREPVLFLGREIEGLLDEAREALANLVGAKADHLSFVPNATYGVNSVLRSLVFQPGDEILLADQEYNATANAAVAAAQRVGARVVTVKIPFPIASHDEAVAPLVAGLTPRTKLVIIDHVTSQTALIMPVERIVAACRERGVDVLIDGAHAPVMVPLELDRLGAAYYTGNCHKWLCAPKGAAFLYVRPDRQDLIQPIAISHGLNSTRTDRSQHRLLFDWTGTTDPTPYLSIPAAIRFLSTLLPGGLGAVREHSHRTCLAARDLVCATWRIAPPAPDSMLGSMASIPLPAGTPCDVQPPLYIHPLQSALFDRYRVEIPVMPWPDGNTWHLRLSAAIYNTARDYEHLCRGLRELLPRR